MSKAQAQYAVNHERRAARTFIKCRPGNKVRVHCPNPAKYPSFARAFHGRAGTVVAVEPHGARDIIVVDVSTQSEPGAFINVERSWLSWNDGRARV